MHDVWSEVCNELTFEKQWGIVLAALAEPDLTVKYIRSQWDAAGGMERILIRDESVFWELSLFRLAEYLSLESWNKHKHEN